MSRLSRCGSETMAESPQFQMLFQWAAVTFSIHTPFIVLFFVKNIGQWNAESGPKAAYGNFAMRTKFSECLDSK